jgi:hypothetical protein
MGKPTSPATMTYPRSLLVRGLLVGCVSVFLVLLRESRVRGVRGLRSGRLVGGALWVMPRGKALPTAAPFGSRP